MVTLTDTQILALLSVLIFGTAGACAGLGAGTKLGPNSTKFLVVSYGFEVAASFLCLWLVTFQTWLGIGILLGSGTGVYQAFKGDKNDAPQLFGWFVFISCIGLLIVVVMTLEALLK